MDYIDHVAVSRHANFGIFRMSIASRRLVLFTTKSCSSPYDFQFSPEDVLLFGKESAGVPPEVAEVCDARIRIPLRSQVRSMNVATAAALGLGEAMRQTGSLPVKQGTNSVRPEV
jgi:tRNA (cytidine/uridine-2'-O-)-methyltransferase